jgi:hypothetical protein
MVLGIALGAFFGRIAAHIWGSSFTLPGRPEPSEWRVISPGLNEGIGQAGAGRTTHIADGALNIASHVFFRPDMVVPQFSGHAALVEIDLAPDSDAVWIQMGPPPGVFVGLRPDQFRVPGSQWQPADDVGSYQLRGEDGVLFVINGSLQVEAGSFAPGRLEMSAAGGWGRVSRVKIQDDSGSLLFESDFTNHGVGASALTVGTMLGALSGLLVGFLLYPLSVSQIVSVMLCLSPIALVFSLPRGTWLAGVERLYLSTTPPSAMASAVLGVAFIPLFGAVFIRVVRMGWNPSKNQSKWGPGMWLLTAVVAAILVEPQGSQHGVMGGFCLFMVLGAARFKKHGVDELWWMDSLCWASVAVLGLEQGVLIAVFWRMVMVLGMTRWWLGRSPRVAVDLLLLSVIACPMSMEVLVRNTILGEAWDASRLADERPNEKGWDNPVAGWTGRCGPDDAARTIHMVVGGGSSVGGAYQFGDEPEAFFTAQAHRKLCDSLPVDTALKTSNFGDGDRNSFTISRTAEEHLKNADLLVMYVGVNDLFTTQNRLTRKQREAKIGARSTAEAGLAGIARNSRLVSGAGLLLRAIPDPEGASVADVPLPDAIENHQILVDAAHKHGSQVVFMTEHVQSWQVPNLEIYSRMQQHMASENEHAHWVDAGAAFSGMSDATILVDSNHLSRAGNRVLGEYLAVQLSPFLFGQGSSL